MNARKPRKEIRKSATTKLNVKFNSPHFNEGKGDKRRRGEARRDETTWPVTAAALHFYFCYLHSLALFVLSNSIEAFGRPTEAAATAAAALRAAFVAA